MIPKSSGFVRLDSNQKIPADAITGTITPPGTLKVFSDVALLFLLSLMLASTAPR